jgi:hypothetical protein
MLLLLISADERLVWPFHHFALAMVATKRFAFVMQCSSFWLDRRNTYQQEWNVAVRMFRLALAVVTLVESLLRLPIRKSDMQTSSKVQC